VDLENNERLGFYRYVDLGWETDFSDIWNNIANPEKEHGIEVNYHYGTNNIESMKFPIYSVGNYNISQWYYPLRIKFDGKLLTKEVKYDTVGLKIERMIDGIWSEEMNDKVRKHIAEKAAKRVKSVESELRSFIEKNSKEKFINPYDVDSQLNEMTIDWNELRKMKGVDFSDLKVNSFKSAMRMIYEKIYSVNFDDEVEYYYDEGNYLEKIKDENEKRLIRGIRSQMNKEDQFRAIGMVGQLMTAYDNIFRMKESPEKKYAVRYLKMAVYMIWKKDLDIRSQTRNSKVRVSTNNFSFCIAQNVAYCISRSMDYSSGKVSARNERIREILYIMSKGEIINFFFKYKSAIKDEKCLGCKLTKGELQTFIINGRYVEPSGLRPVSNFDKAYYDIEESEIFDHDLYKLDGGKELKALVIKYHSFEEFNDKVASDMSDFLEAFNFGIYMRGPIAGYYREQFKRPKGLLAPVPEYEKRSGQMGIPSRFSDDAVTKAYRFVYDFIYDAAKKYNHLVPKGDDAVVWLANWLTHKSNGDKKEAQKAGIEWGTRVGNFQANPEVYKYEELYIQETEIPAKASFRDQIGRRSRTIMMTPNAQQFCLIPIYIILIAAIKKIEAISLFFNVGLIKDMISVLTGGGNDDRIIMMADASNMDGSVHPHMKNILYSAVYEAVKNDYEAFGPFKETTEETPKQRLMKVAYKIATNAEYIIKDGDYGMEERIRLETFQTGNLITSSHHSIMLYLFNLYFFKEIWKSSHVNLDEENFGLNGMGDDVLIVLKRNVNSSYDDVKNECRRLQKLYESYSRNIVGLIMEATINPCSGEYLKHGGFGGCYIPYRQRLNPVTDERPNLEMDLLIRADSIRTILLRMLQRGCDDDLVLNTMKSYRRTAFGFLPHYYWEGPDFRFPKEEGAIVLCNDDLRRYQTNLNDGGLIVPESPYMASSFFYMWDEMSVSELYSQSVSYDGRKRWWQQTLRNSYMKNLPLDALQYQGMSSDKKNYPKNVNAVTQFYPTSVISLSVQALNKIRKYRKDVPPNAAIANMGIAMYELNEKTISKPMRSIDYWSKILFKWVPLTHNHKSLPEFLWFKMYDAKTSSITYTSKLSTKSILIGLNQPSKDNVQRKLMLKMGPATSRGENLRGASSVRSLIPTSLNTGYIIDLAQHVEIYRDLTLDDVMNMAGIIGNKRYEFETEIRNAINNFSMEYKGISLRMLTFYNLEMNVHTLSSVTKVNDAKSHMQEVSLLAAGLELFACYAQESPVGLVFEKRSPRKSGVRYVESMLRRT
jgi:hypothetical protein